MVSDLRLTVESLIVFNFLRLFSNLEAKLQRIFLKAYKNPIQEPTYNEKRMRLLFIQEAVAFKNCEQIDIGSTDITNHVINYNSLYRNPTNLSTLQMVRFDKNYPLIAEFNLDIPSINGVKVSYRFHDCCEKLIKMRNILAHNTNEIIFRNEDIIDHLSKDSYEKNKESWLVSVEFDTLSHQFQEIYANYVVAKYIENKLEAYIF